ncbi:MAG: 30S ribosomal protein S21 [Bacteroidales bacterium]|nr:30S ribosomal protein S21 [Bacteroidales bacterium]
MIIVQLKEGDTIDKALKKLKRRFEKTGLSRELRKRQHYIKPSERRREARARALFIQRLMSSQTHN